MRGHQKTLTALKMKYKLVELNELRLMKNIPVMFDTETVGLYGRIRLAQFYQDGWPRALIVENPDPVELKELLADCWVVAHNASYDITTIQRNLGGVSWCPDRLDDTFYLSRLHFYKEGRFDLASCIFYATGDNPYWKLDSAKGALQKSDWGAEVLTEEQLEYAAVDVVYLKKLWDVVRGCREDLSYVLDIVTLKSCLNFQNNGMPTDIARINMRYAENVDAIDAIGLPVNCNSPKQVRDYLGTSDTTDLTLARLSNDPDMGDKAIAVRTVRKLTKVNSFFDKFLAEGARIRGVFAPNARSGRCTCKDQNLQQIPRSTKDCFGVSDDFVMVYSDFSQLELRCICAVAGDKNMDRLYREGVDIHTYTAKSIFNTEEPTKQQRHIAKTCNFSLLYGGGAATFASRLLASTGIEITETQAANIKRKWLAVWKDIARWQQRGIQDWRKGKAWQTPLGRRYLAERVTDQLNIQIQGMGAEVSKLANHYMNKRLSEAYPEEYKKYQVNFIHDSYIFVVPNDPDIYKTVSGIVAESMQLAWQEMSSACKIKDLPMPVQVLVGRNWGEIESDDFQPIYSLNI